MGIQKINFIKRVVPVWIMEGIIVIAAISFFVMTIKQGHDWGGDFAQYISHAINFADGRPYKETGYIFNPNASWYGPETYPPVFPFLLSGVYAVYGMDLTTMRIMILFCYLVFLVVFCIYCEKRLQTNFAKISVVLTVAFSPFYWDIKNSVLSEITFLMFLYVALLISDKIDKLQQNGREGIIEAVAFGIVCYLAYGTTRVGLLLIVAFCVNQVINRRDFSDAFLVSVFVFFSLFLWQDSILHTNKSHVDIVADVLNKGVLNADPGYLGRLYHYSRYIFNNIIGHAFEYMRITKSYWEAGSNGVIGGIVSVMISFIAGLGFIKMIRKSVSAGDIFFVIYLALLLFAPFFQESRFLSPIFPMYVVYLYKLFDYKGREEKIRFQNIANLLIAILITTIYTVSYMRTDYSPYQYGVYKQTSQELFDYIKKYTPADSLIIFQKPRVMALYGDRKSSSYFYGIRDGFDETKLKAFLKEVKATHIVTSNGVWGDEEWDEFVRWTKKERNFLEEEFRNSDFTVYAITDRGGKRVGG